MALHPDRLFPADPGTRGIARRLYGEIAGLPIVSPHGHTDPAWYAEDRPFPDPAQLFVVPDHYVFRMLYSQGVPLEALGVPRRDGGADRDGRTRHLAPLRQTHSAVPRHADAAVVRARAGIRASASTSG